MVGKLVISTNLMNNDSYWFVKNMPSGQARQFGTRCRSAVHESLKNFTESREKPVESITELEPTPVKARL